MKTKYYAYVRVSTIGQSVHGTSLSEQREAITQYADKHDLIITEWLEEVQSAARGKRRVFAQLVERLQTTQNAGLIIHKIDRGARSLRDWASLGELIDKGVDVRFAHDDLDMNSRGGRLSADIQAVIAADYVRNLRDEVKKGIQGRLRQGLYPFAAPYGYTNNGGGAVKTPDPIKAALVIEAFRQYGSGEHSLRSLGRKTAILGMRTKTGHPLCPQRLSSVLRNPFYIGKIRHLGGLYDGIHQPLVSHRLFEIVQKELKQRGHKKRTKRRFKYSRRLRCRTCSYSLIGERQRGHIYYRCHVCPKISIREDRIETEQTVSCFILNKNTPQLSCFSDLQQ